MPSPETPTLSRDELLKQAQAANAHLAKPQEVAKPWWLTATEFGISSAAQMGGEALLAGAAAPAAVGEAATGVGIPAAGATEALAGATGAGIGSVAGDVANRALERATGYSKAPIIPSAGEAATSFGLGAAGSLGGRVLGAIGSRLSGLRAGERGVEEAVTKKAATAEVEKAAVQEEAAAKQAVGQAVKLTPEQAAQATEKGFEERAAVGAEGRAAVKGARGARIKETGELFNPIFDPIKDNQIDRETLMNVQTEAGQAVDNFLAKRGIVNPTGRANALKELSPDAKNYIDQVNQLVKRIPGHQPAGFTAQAIPAETIVKQGSIGEFRTLNSQMMALAAKTNDPTERGLLRVASEPLRNVLDQAVPEEQQPLLAALKQQYAQINKELPFSLAQKIDKATNFPQMGNIVFGDAKKIDTAMELWRGANPEQKELLKQMFAQDLMLNHGKSSTEIAKALEGKGKIVKAMFGDTAWGNVDTWVNADTRALAKEKLLNESGPARTEFERGIRQAFDEAGKQFEAKPTTARLRQLTQEERAGAFAKGIKQATNETTARWIKHHMIWLGIGAAGGLAYGGPRLETAGMEAAGLGAFLLTRAARAALINNPTYQRAIMQPSIKATGYYIGRALTVAGVEAAKGEPQQ